MPPSTPSRRASIRRSQPESSHGGASSVLAANAEAPTPPRFRELADARTRLLDLVDAYVTTVDRNRTAIRIMLSAMGELPPREREESRRTQRAHVDVWVDLLREVTGSDAATARIRARAALLVVNTAAHPQMRVQPGFRTTLRSIVATLMLPTPAEHQAAPNGRLANREGPVVRDPIPDQARPSCPAPSPGLISDSIRLAERWSDASSPTRR